MSAEELFLKNTQALFSVDEILAYKLKMHKPQRFVLTPDLNLLDRQSGALMYANLKENLQEDYVYFKQNYEKYPVLFFYGLANGELVKILLENHAHKHIVVFEPELDAIYWAFHAFDFSANLKKERLILFYTPSLTPAQLSTLFNYENVARAVKTYNFFPQNEFYATHYKAQIDELNAQIIHTIKYSVLGRGNDPVDSIVGIKQALENLPDMIENVVFQDFLKLYKGRNKNAIIVATGPSLKKQLGLLKEYQDRAVIFCADSSYDILHRYGIKPDFVLSLERIELTSEFFNNDFGAFDQNILFILSSLTHPNSIKYLKKAQRERMLVLRPLPFSVQLGLPEFGYLGTGHSVANMAFELAGALRFERIILIGQDLAYSKEGVSHIDEYKNLDSHEGDFEKDKDKFIATAYGGEGFVQSSVAWTLFRQSFEKDIVLIKNMLKIDTFNCTEGGARIAGSIEAPFKEVCELYLNAPKTPYLNLPFLSKEQIKQQMTRLHKELSGNVEKLRQFSQDCKKELEKVDMLLSIKEIEDLNLNAAKVCKKALIKLKSRLKDKQMLTEVIDGPLFHNDCELVRVEAMPIRSAFEEKDIMIFWLNTQKDWFREILLYLNAQQKAIEDNLHLLK